MTCRKRNGGETRWIFDLDDALFPTSKYISNFGELNFYNNINPNSKEIKKISSLLKKLPGKKYILTNGSFSHGKEVCEQCKWFGPNLIEGIIGSDIFGIQKPNPIIYTNCEKWFNFNAQTDKIIFFEDTLENLESAKSTCGWHTVLISKSKLPKQNKKMIDHVFPTIQKALQFYLKTKN